MSFEALGLGPEILKAIDECGYTEPTPIQEKAIPNILMTRDVIGLAQTGTGKTASFIVPMIEILAGGRARARMPRSLVLAPTRELAAQVAENFDTYGKYHKLTKALLIGGTSMGEQMKTLDRGVDVLIATPGRLLDLFERGSILLTDIKILVIDEADRMLDMGFIPDIEKIISLVPPIRQTLLFSATMPPEIQKLSQKFLSNPKEISVDSASSTAETVEQAVIWTSPRNKRDVLRKLVEQNHVKNAFVFCNRKRDVDDVAKWLKNKGFQVAPMHGDMAQSVRNETLDKFKKDEIRLLICSDVAARGLDVEAVSHVINYDVPFSPEDYVHRIGRTGRAGMEGHSWTLATKSEEKYVRAIEKLIKTDIPDYDPDKGGKSDKDKGHKDDKSSKAKQEDSNASHGKQKDKKPSKDQKQDNKPQAQKSKKQDNKQNNNQQGKNQGKQGGKQKGQGGGDASAFGDDVPAFLRRK